MTYPDLPDQNIPSVIRFVMFWSGGLIKEQKTAQYIILGICILAVLTSIFLMTGVLTSSTQEPHPNLMQRQPIQ
jgi:hypothetical protein